MPNKVIADLKLDDKAVLKDATYGSGTLVGINKKTNEHLIGYKSTDSRASGAWTNAGGKFPEAGTYSDNIKNFSHYLFVPATAELHSNDSGNDGLTVGDTVELYCDANGTLTTNAAARDAKQTRKGTVVGFYENGSPLIYIEKSDLKEIGSAYSNTFNRYTHESFEGKLDTGRAAYINGANGLANGWLKQVKKGKVKKMSNSNSNGDRPAFLDMMKGDLKDAAYRVASKQMVDGTRTAILKVMESKGQSSDRIQALSDLLNTELGHSLISMCLGLGLNYVPMISEDPRAQKLSQEFRIGSMATAGNAAVDMLTQHFLPVITQALNALPQEGTAVRVGETVSKKEETEEVKEEEKAAENQKTMTA